MHKTALFQIIKRISYVNEMIKKNIKEKTFYISGKKVKIVIDETVMSVIKIMDYIINIEDNESLKTIYKGIRNGKKDSTIMCDVLIGRTKYYILKSEFISKIMVCGVTNGLFDVEEVIRGPLF